MKYKAKSIYEIKQLIYLYLAALYCKAKQNQSESEKISVKGARRTNQCYENVLNDPAKYLQEATTFFYYDLNAWTDRNEPPQSIMIARETHVRDLADGETTKIQKTIAYSDGYGRELQTKIMVEPGLAWVKYPDDTFKEEWSDPRWLVSGRTVYNNKQKPIKQYEPFYSASHTYEPEEFFAEYGVTPIIHYDPLLRVVRTDTPKGFFSKVEFNPWMIERFDENDTVKDSEYYDIVINQGGIGLKPQMNTDERGLWLEDEKEALLKAEEHYNTPRVSVLDTLGREFMSIEYLKDIDQATEDDRLVTYTKFNITGKPLAITDPRQYAEQSGVKTFRYTYNMNDQVTRTINIDAGDDRVLNNILGNPIFSMDKKGHQISISYDLLQRPINTHVTGNGLNNTTERLIYGESIPNATALNLRGQLYQHYDQSGLNEVSLYSFKGEPINTAKRIRSEYKEEADWQDGADWNSLLESETFTTTTTYDALGRIKHQYNPDQSEVEPEFHQSGKLNKVRVKLKGETEFTEFVASITYNPKGQREIITYGNYTRTEYTYERETFRLTSLKTIRQTDNRELQDITYTYDPVGNITKIVDNSHERVFNNNQVVEPEHKYTYDAIYRLIEANGREHVGLNVPDYYKNTESFKQSSFINLENTNDSNKLANYTRQYTYDKSGNLHRIQHIASDSFRSFTRDIAVDQYTNRAILKESDDPINFNDYFDVNGNCLQLENIASLEWNYKDNISSAVVIQRETQPDDAEYYVYDAGGNRVRKVTERLINSTQLEVEEKIYLGGVEIKRISQQNSLIFERSSLHVMDDKKRIAIVHNWIQDDLNREVPTSDLNTNKTRYQFENHLGSASLELDDAGQIISYEEYFPYGGTSFIAGTNQAEVKLKEYRYSGKERDDTTGLYYYGARYYAPWLGRWMCCDPEGPVDNWNLYLYVNDNPLKYIDNSGNKLGDVTHGNDFQNTKDDTYNTYKYDIYALGNWPTKGEVTQENKKRKGGAYNEYLKSTKWLNDRYNLKQELMSKENFEQNAKMLKLYGYNEMKYYGLGSYGCYLFAYMYLAESITGKNIDPVEVNNLKELFTGASLNNPIGILKHFAGDEYEISNEVFNKDKLFNKDSGNIQSEYLDKIKNAVQSEDTFYIHLRVEGYLGGEHSVLVKNIEFEYKKDEKGKLTDEIIGIKKIEVINPWKGIEDKTWDDLLEKTEYSGDEIKNLIKKWDIVSVKKKNKEK